MQPTVSALWSELDRWQRRRGRLTLAELSEIAARAHQIHLQEMRRLRELHARLEWPRVHRPEIVLYTPGQHKQHIRLGNSAEDTIPAAQPTSSTVWRPGPLGTQWQFSDSDLMTQSRIFGAGKTSSTADVEWSVWKAARSWGAGALLLIVALLLVRATDRCLTRNYARSRRRRSEEWPTPNVLATSNRPVDPEVPNEFETYPSETSDASNDVIFNADLPPPYSECATDANKRNNREEPPPPYSECHIAFTIPKHGTPSVRFLNTQQQNEDMSTTARYINVQTSTEELTEIAHSSNGFNHIDTGQMPHNPIGDRIHRIPYVENATERDDESEVCNGNCITDSLECINVGPAPLASEELSTGTQDDVTIEMDHYTEEIASC